MVIIKIVIFTDSETGARADRTSQWLDSLQSQNCPSRTLLDEVSPEILTTLKSAINEVIK